VKLRQNPARWDMSGSWKFPTAGKYLPSIQLLTVVIASNDEATTGLAATVHLLVLEFSLETALFGKVKVRWLLAVVLGAAVCQTSIAVEPDRKVVNRVKPEYPELARQMHVTGTVKIEVAISASGSVKSLKPIGGHPLLIQSASEALKKWRFAPGPESTTVVEFQFRQSGGRPPTAKEQP
jgi:TonB family protein